MVAKSTINEGQDYDVDDVIVIMPGFYEAIKRTTGIFYTALMQAQLRILSNLGLDPYAFRVLVHIMSKGGSLEASMENIAVECRMSKTSVIQACTTLENSGVVIIGKGHGRVPTSILVNETLWKNLAEVSVQKWTESPSASVQSTDTYPPGKRSFKIEYIQPTLKAFNVGNDTNVECSVGKLNALHTIIERTSDERDPQGTGTLDPAPDDLDSLFPDPLPELESLFPVASLLTPTLKGSFKLKPPSVSSNARGKRPKRTPKNRRGSSVPPEILDKVVGICYGVETPQQWLTVDKTALGRCSDAVARLIGSGADLTQLGQWYEWWKAFAKNRPSPDQLVRNWWKGIGQEKPTPDAVGTAEQRATRDALLKGKQAENERLTQALQSGMLRRLRGEE